MSPSHPGGREFDPRPSHFFDFFGNGEKVSNVIPHAFPDARDTQKSLTAREFMDPYAKPPHHFAHLNPSCERQIIIPSIVTAKTFNELNSMVVNEHAQRVSLTAASNSSPGKTISGRRFAGTIPTRTILFKVPRPMNQDRRSELLRDGDIESNPGPLPFFLPLLRKILFVAVLLSLFGFSERDHDANPWSYKKPNYQTEASLLIAFCKLENIEIEQNGAKRERKTKERRQRKKKNDFLPLSLVSLFQQLEKQKIKNQNIKNELQKIKRQKIQQNFFLLFSFCVFFCFFLFFFSLFSQFLLFSPFNRNAHQVPSMSNRSKFEVQTALVRGCVELNPGPRNLRNSYGYPSIVVKPDFPVIQPIMFSFELHEGPPKKLSPQPQFADFDHVFYVDGGSDLRKGTAAAAVVHFTVADRQPHTHARYLPKQTNNTGEALAELAALRIAEALGGKCLILGDSEFCLRGVTGINVIKKEHLIPIVDEARSIFDRIADRVTFARIEGHGSQPNLADQICTEVQSRKLDYDPEPLRFDVPEAPPRNEKSKKTFPQPPGTQPNDIIWDACLHWDIGTEFHCEWLIEDNPEVFRGPGTVIERRPGQRKLIVCYSGAGPNGSDVTTSLPPPRNSNVFVTSLRPISLKEVRNRPVSVGAAADEILEPSSILDNDEEEIPTHRVIDDNFVPVCICAFRKIILDYPKSTPTEKERIFLRFLSATKTILRAECKSRKGDNEKSGDAGIDPASARREAAALPEHHHDGGHGENSPVVESLPSIAGKSAHRDSIHDPPAHEPEPLPKHHCASDPDEERLVKRALEYVRLGHSSKASRLMDTVLRKFEITDGLVLDKLRRLHPTGPNPPGPPSTTSVGMVSPTELRIGVRKINNGAAPGVTGLSGDILALLCTDPSCNESLRHMVCDILNGSVTKEVRQRLVRSRLVALPKPDDGVRPIAIGDALLKLSGVILLNRFKTTIQKYFADLQFGCLCPGGTETVVHNVRADVESGHCLFTLDFSNAFNSPSRVALADALYSVQAFEAFWPIFDLEYGLPSELFVFNDGSLSDILLSASGVRQGSALGGFFFCVGLHPILLRCRALFGDKVRIYAYMDDVSITGADPLDVAAAGLFVREEGRKIGLFLNESKCEWFGGPLPASLFELRVRERLDHIKILGAYVGAPAVCSESLLEKARKHEVFFQRLKSAGPGTRTFPLLRLSGAARGTYHARTHLQPTSAAMCDFFDDSVLDVMRCWSGSALSSDSREAEICRLPTRLGGLGLPLLSEIAGAAYVDSRDRALRALNIHAVDEQRPVSQTIAQDDLNKLRLAKLNATPLVRHHLRETSREHAARWLSAHRLHIPRALFSVWLRRRMLARHTAEPDRLKCGCGRSFDNANFVAHVVGCASRPGNNSRKKHDALVELLVDFCSRAGVTHEKEPRGFQRYKCYVCGRTVPLAEVRSHKRVCTADLIRSGPDLRAWVEEVENFYDFTTLHITAPSHLQDLLDGVSDKKILEKVIAKKCDTYRLNFPPERFIVITAFEHGGLDKPLVKLIRFLADKAQAHASEWLDEFSVRLATWNADALLTGLRQSSFCFSSSSFSFSSFTPPALPRSDGRHPTRTPTSPLECQP